MVEASASCTGECRGSCSVDFVEPRCTGDVRAPMASAECTASCDADVSAQATCTEGSVELVVIGTLDASLQARADRVSAAYRVGAADLYQLHARVGILSASLDAFVASSADAADAAGSLGARATACTAAAAAETADTADSIRASVSVTVDVSASLSATAS